MHKTLIAAAIALTVSAFAYAAEPTEQELVIFTAHKYKADYTQQPEAAQNELKKEFDMVSVVAPKVLAQGLSNDTEYKISSEILTFELWVKKYAESLNISDEELKKVYEAREVNVNPSYSLHNILVKDEKTADGIIKTLSGVKDIKALVAKFEALAKEKSIDPVTSERGGNAGWVEMNRLEQPLQDVIAAKKTGEYFKYKAGSGWQVIYIDDYHPSRKATFEEAKPMLINIIKQVEIGKKIQAMMQEQ